MTQTLPRSEVINGLWKIVPEGRLGEDLELPEIPLSLSEVYVDLDQIKYFNSMSIKHWIRWVQALEQVQTTLGSSPQVMFDNVPTVFLKLVEPLPQMLPKNLIIKKFYIGCSCMDCFATKNTLIPNTKKVIESETLFKHSVTPVCEVCGFETELDLSARFYTSLLKYSPKA